MKKVKLIILSIICTLVFSCQKTVNLTIESHDVNGAPISGMNVSISYVEHSDSGPTVASGTTDADGKYKLTKNLYRNKSYKVSVFCSSCNKTFTDNRRYFKAGSKNITLVFTSTN